jgi:hypothetical protein
MLLMVVDYDHAGAGDADVKAMLESLRLHKGGARSDVARWGNPTTACTRLRRAWLSSLTRP